MTNMAVVEKVYENVMFCLLSKNSSDYYIHTRDPNNQECQYIYHAIRKIIDLKPYVTGGK